MTAMLYVMPMPEQEDIEERIHRVIDDVARAREDPAIRAVLSDELIGDLYHGMLRAAGIAHREGELVVYP